MDPYQVKVNGDKIGEFDSTPESIYTFLGIEEEDVNSVTLESLGIGEDEWISLLEVSNTAIGTNRLRPDGGILHPFSLLVSMFEVSLRLYSARRTLHIIKVQ